jgi:transposase-like protein
VIVVKNIEIQKTECYTKNRSNEEAVTMAVTLKEILRLAKELPEECFEETYIKLKEIKEKAEREKEGAPVSCIRCGSDNVVRNGKQNGRQAYLCKDCHKGFVETSTSAIAHTHSSATVWKQVIRDTIDGISIDKTADSLELAHSTVFNMRHKILCCVEQDIIDSHIEMEGVCEVDETYVLESVKGRKIAEDYHRKPRKHGAVASKRGISDEYICVCTSVDSDNRCTTAAVNRAMPSKEEIAQVFSDKVSSETVILCDGNPKYDVLEEQCTVAHTKRVNKVNGFHSFIKERLVAARGVATIYLNRYNAFYSQIYGKNDLAATRIFELMTARDNSFATISTVKSRNLLTI